MPSLSKITRPTYSGIFQRKRLFKLLDLNRKRRVIWISAPAGYGKTILVSSYMEANKLPCLWYQIDSGDSDAATFFYYMGLAAKKAAPKVHDLPLLTPEYMPGLPTFTRRYFESLYNRLPTHSYIVFDNYHEAASGAPLHTIISEGISVMPPDITVIIISRHDAPPALARHRTDNSMEIIGQDELNLTQDESRGLIKTRFKNSDNKILKGLFSDVFDRSRGWAAGLVLMMEKARKGGVKSLGDVTGETIYDYFASEILDKLDSATLAFLLKTALLASMDAEMAGKLTGIDDAGQILATLNKKNCFTERRFHANPTYQYHPLFREFLLSRARSVFNRNEIRLLQSRAAELMEAAGKYEDALNLLQESNDYAGMARVILKCAKPLMAQGRGIVLEKWIAALPRDMVDINPWLKYWFGVCRMPFDLSESREHLEQAYRLFEISREPIGIYHSWSSIVETFFYEWSDFKPLDHWISEFGRLTAAYPEFPSPEVEARSALGMFCALMYRQPHHADMPAWEERMQRLLLSSEDVRLRITIGTHLIHYYTWWVGNAAKAALVVDALRPVAGSKKATPLLQIALNTIESIYYRQIGAHDECMKAVREGLNAAEESGVHLWDFMLYAQGMCSTLTCGNVAAAKEYLDKTAASFNPKRRMHTAHYHFLAAWFATYKDDLRTGLEHAQTALDLIVAAGSPFFEAVGNYALSDVLIERGEYESGLACLTVTKKIANAIRSQSIEYQSLIREAYCYLKQKKDGAIAAPLARSMSIAKEYGFINYTWWRPSVMLQLYTKALELEIEVEYVRKLIKMNNLTPVEPPVHLENWPWPVKIYTLGRFNLIKDDKPVSFIKKSQQKPVELLKAIIAFGGRDVDKEKIMDAIWPETDGDAAQAVLDTTLHRLRHILGSDEIVRLSDGRLTLDARYCWVDLWALERILGRIDTEVQDRGYTDKAVQMMGRAIGMYGDHFLAEADNKPWTILLRERLREKLLHHINDAGSYFEKKGDFENAIRFFQKGIRVDMLMEAFYQRLMNCYRQLDRRSEGIAVYHRLKKILLSSLQVAPSQATEAAYRALL